MAAAVPARKRWRKPRNRAQASTAARGYGYAHIKLAAALLAAWQPGDLCTRCGKPMWQRWTVTRSGRRVSAIHLGHTDDRTAYRGLEHAACNLRDGAVRGNRARTTANGATAIGGAAAVRPSRAW